MTRKTYLIIIVPLLIFALAGCASLQPAQPAQAGNSAANPTQDQAQQPDTTPTPNNSIEFRLAPGTLKLESTPLAVTADEAKQLLPLWEKVKSLSADTTASQTDIQTAYQQIQDAMTPSQIQAIEQMTLAQSDLQTLAQSLGVQFNSGGGPNGGSFPTMSPDQLATRTARRTQTPGANGGLRGGGSNPGGNRGGRGFSMVFVDPLIQLLTQRAGQ
jgi:hypothetical protein